MPSRYELQLQRVAQKPCQAGSRAWPFAQPVRCIAGPASALWYQPQSNAHSPTWSQMRE